MNEMKNAFISKPIKKYKQALTSFGGLNVSDSSKQGEMRSAKNMSSNRLPFLSSRPPRTVHGIYNLPTALYEWNGTVAVDGTDLIYAGEKVGAVVAGAKQFCVVGTKLVIWPDKMYLDLVNGEYKPLEVSLESEAVLNMIENGGFENGLTGWTVRGASATVTDGVLVTTATAQHGNVSKTIPITPGHVYYGRAMARRATAQSTGISFIVIAASGNAYNGVVFAQSETLEMASVLFTAADDATSLTVYIGDGNASGWGARYVDDILLQDITLRYPGREISKAWCDENLTYSENGIGDVVFTADTLQMGAAAGAASQTDTLTYAVGGTAPTVKVYSSVSWDGTEWTKTGAAEKLATAITAGDIIIPTKVELSGAYAIGTKSGGVYPADNTDGHYYDVTSVTSTAGYNYRWAAHQLLTGVAVGLNEYDVPVYATVYYPGSFLYYVYGVEDDTYTAGASNGFFYIGPEVFVSAPTVEVSYDIYIDGGVVRFSDFLKAGDVVSVTGCTSTPENNIAPPSSSTDVALVIESVTDDTLTFVNSVFTPGTEVGPVKVTRVVPDFEYICSSNNRLWGVKDQTIYASALGDPAVYYDFSPLSTASYQAAVNSRGAFTGCCEVDGMLLFFKEDDLVYKVFGNQPSEYYYSEEQMPSLQAGCHKSLQVINGALYYKSKTGIYRYSGGSFRLISYDLGPDKYSSAVAGSEGTKYYISMVNNAGVWGLFVYDTIRNAWMREDAQNIADFAKKNGELYMLSATTAEVLVANRPGTAEIVPWEVELVEITEATLGKKRYMQLAIRAELGTNALLRVDVAADAGAYLQVYLTTDTTKQIHIIPLLPTPCDALKIKLSGVGAVAIKAIERDFTVGSEM